MKAKQIQLQQEKKELKDKFFKFECQNDETRKKSNKLK